MDPFQFNGQRQGQNRMERMTEQIHPGNAIDQYNRNRNNRVDGPHQQLQKPGFPLPDERTTQPMYTFEQMKQIGYKAYEQRAQQESHQPHHPLHDAGTRVEQPLHNQQNLFENFHQPEMLVVRSPQQHPQMFGSRGQVVPDLTTTYAEQLQSGRPANFKLEHPSPPDWNHQLDDVASGGTYENHDYFQTSTVQPFHQQHGYRKPSADRMVSGHQGQAGQTTPFLCENSYRDKPMVTGHLGMKVQDSQPTQQHPTMFGNGGQDIIAPMMDCQPTKPSESCRPLFSNPSHPSPPDWTNQMTNTNVTPVEPYENRNYFQTSPAQHSIQQHGYRQPSAERLVSKQQGQDEPRTTAQHGLKPSHQQHPIVQNWQMTLPHNHRQSPSETKQHYISFQHPDASMVSRQQGKGDQMSSFQPESNYHDEPIVTPHTEMQVQDSQPTQQHPTMFGNRGQSPPPSSFNPPVGQNGFSNWTYQESHQQSSRTQADQMNIIQHDNNGEDEPMTDVQPVEQGSSHSEPAQRQMWSCKTTQVQTIDQLSTSEPQRIFLDHNGQAQVEVILPDKSIHVFHLFHDPQLSSNDQAHHSHQQSPSNNQEESSPAQEPYNISSPNEDQTDDIDNNDPLFDAFNHDPIPVIDAEQDEENNEDEMEDMGNDDQLLFELTNCPGTRRIFDNNGMLIPCSSCQFGSKPTEGQQKAKKRPWKPVQSEEQGKKRGKDRVYQDRTMAKKKKEQANAEQEVDTTLKKLEARRVTNHQQEENINFAAASTQIIIAYGVRNDEMTRFKAEEVKEGKRKYYEEKLIEIQNFNMVKRNTPAIRKELENLKVATKKYRIAIKMVGAKKRGWNPSRKTRAKKAAQKLLDTYDALVYGQEYCHGTELARIANIYIHQTVFKACEIFQSIPRFDLESIMIAHNMHNQLLEFDKFVDKYAYLFNLPVAQEDKIK